VTFEELDVALEELETRLERLRALYEQYFLGFEKIEPAVARKDVDRRIYVLRREKIRNTGKRFKLQTIIQRYNTFQQYWQRICREIENGTYKRHLLRAEKLMAPEMQLTIAAKRRFGKVAAAGDAQREAAAGERPNEATGSDAPATFSASEAPTEVMPRATEQPESDDLATGRPPPAPASDQVPRRAPPPKPVRARLLSSPSPPRPKGSEKLESLELDMGFLGSWAPPPPKGAPRPKSSPKAAPPPEPERAAAPPPRPKSSPKAAALPRPAAPPAEPAALAPPRPAAPPPKPAAPPPKPAARPAEPARAGLTDERVKDLHEKLSALKAQNREASQVSLETLKKTLHDAESKLREKHQGRKIDFEVVLRDGKAIVKPTVR
jgi:hypothetical protein